MTDREKLVELRKEAEKHLTNICCGHSCGQCSYDKDGNDCGEYVMADHLIANGVTFAADNNVGYKMTPTWIPVTERLPEECGVFLVCGNRRGIYTAEFRKFSDFGGEYPHWHKLNSKNHHCEPTHWMPLPEPPKGE